DAATREQVMQALLRRQRDGLLIIASLQPVSAPGLQAVRVDGSIRIMGGLQPPCGPGAGRLQAPWLHRSSAVRGLPLAPGFRLRGWALYPGRSPAVGGEWRAQHAPGAEAVTTRYPQTVWSLPATTPAAPS